MRSSWTRTIGAVTVLTLAASACGAAGDDATSSGVEDGSGSTLDRSSGWTEDGEALPSDPDWAGGGSAFSELATTDDAAGAPEGARESDAPAPAALQTLAGSVDDNENWDAYLRYLGEAESAGVLASLIDVSGRQVLTVVDADGEPVLGASITVTDAAGVTVANLRTYSDGRAVFHGSSAVDPTTQQRQRYTARVVKGEVDVEVGLDPGSLAQTIELEASIGDERSALDVLFLIDATGSMSDEIERLKANMIEVAERIGDLPGEPDVRYAMVIYRDRGDEFVTRSFDFTGDVDEFTTALAQVVADGGGDVPEALGAGLHDAVASADWRGDDAVKLVFLLADAAPHLAGEAGYEDEPDYADDVVTAAALGVKIFPIASSGLDAQGQYIFRQLAQVTMGRFVFLTYGADGQSPGTSTPHDVDPDDYDVLALDDLVVQLVRDELAG